VSFRDIVFEIGAIVTVPDCMTTLTTTSACIAAMPSSLTTTQSTRCDNNVGSGYVITTSPTKGAQVIVGTKVAIASSLGTCSTTLTKMVNCISQTVAACQTLVTAAFSSGVTLSSSSSTCPAGYTSGKIFSQAPAPGKKTATPATLNVNYCP
jgi:beta-lactam-binding protein with PASTA domain